MGYAVGYQDGRWIGYGVPAECDFPGCGELIDLGMGYQCENIYVYDEETAEESYEDGCGMFFCATHRNLDCRGEHLAVQPKPNHPGWKLFILTEDSWAKWREEEPKVVKAYEEELSDPEVRAKAIQLLKDIGEWSDDDEEQSAEESIPTAQASDLE